jgi:hypothetical protein
MTQTDGKSHRATWDYVCWMMQNLPIKLLQAVNEFVKVNFQSAFMEKEITFEYK